MKTGTQRFRRTVVSRAVITALWGTAAMMAAQETLAQQTSLDRVEITGSLIRRIDAETALPVTVIRSEELQRAGVTNAEQAVQFITQQQGGTVTSASVSGTNGGAAYADLRNLGAQRTLVLLNGRRIVGNPYQTVAVDLNSLPMSAVDRIETLSDGASSTYGTDAIAGVINFITRKDYKGATVSAQTQITEHGGGNIHSGGILAGVGDVNAQGWNVYGSIGVRRQEPLKGTDRDFMATSYIPERGFNGTSPTTFPANYSQVVAGTTTVAAANPSSPACDPSVGSISIPEANGTRVRCFADTQMWTNVVPKQDQVNAFVRGTMALGPNNRATLEYFRSDNKVQAQIAPSPEGGLAVAPDSPFYPGNGLYPAAPGLDPTRPINVNWRTTAIGPRRSQQENTTQRLVGAVEGSFGDWDYNGALLWSKAEVEGTFLSGWPMTQALRNGLRGCTLTAPAATSACGPSLGLYLNPFGAQTPAGQAYLEANQVLGTVQTSEATLQSAQMTVSRSFGSLAGGPIAVALTGEFRKEDNLYLTDVPKVSQAASSGLAGQGARREGDRDVKAVGVEAVLPVTKTLEVNVGVRYDNYSDFGDTVNPKVAVRWNPTNTLLIRSSYNTGFAAPTLAQLYAPNATTFTATRYNDPVLCPGGTVNTAQGGQAARDCGIQFQRLTGGNPNLTPEESKAFSLGFVLQLSQQWSAGLDYWNYHVKNSISSGLSETSIFADPAKYADLFVRCSQAPAARAALVPGCQQPGGDPLAYIINTNLNLGDYKTSGFDLQVNYTGPTTPMGRFYGSLRSTYVKKYEFQTEPGGAWFNPVGNYNAQFGGPVIRYQHVATLGWERGPWSAQLTNRHISGYFDQNNAATVAVGFRDNRVGSYSLWNLSASWKATRNLTVGVGVLNLLDTDPPFTNQASRFQARGYDDRFHNPLGRTYQLSARYEF